MNTSIHPCGNGQEHWQGIIIEGKCWKCEKVIKRIKEEELTF